MPAALGGEEPRGAARAVRRTVVVDAPGRRLPRREAEARIPRRGIGTRRCPRCAISLETAGWTGLVLDRCTRCRGLFVEARELLHMERERLPDDALTIEARFQGAMLSAGWALLTAHAIALLLMRFMR